MDFVRRQAIDNVNNGTRTYLAAAIVIKNNIIAVGRNQMKTHPFQVKYAKHPEAIFLHAEIHCISNSLNHIHKDDLKKATLYIYRVKRPNKLRSNDWIDGLAKPCKGCASAIAEFGFERVIYSTDEKDNYAVLT